MPESFRNSHRIQYGEKQDICLISCLVFSSYSNRIRHGYHSLLRITIQGLSKKSKKIVGDHLRSQRALFPH